MHDPIASYIVSIIFSFRKHSTKGELGTTQLDRTYLSLELLWSCTSDKFRFKIQIQNQHCSIPPFQNPNLRRVRDCSFTLNAVYAMFFISFAFHAIILRVGSYFRFAFHAPLCCVQLRVTRIYSALLILFDRIYSVVFITCCLQFTNTMRDVSNCELVRMVLFYCATVEILPIPWASLRFFLFISVILCRLIHYNELNWSCMEVSWS